MALARKLGRNKGPKKKFKLPQISKRNLVISLVVLAVLAGAIGWWSLARSTKNDKGKIAIKYDTGDKPLPQKVLLWINADGGLNVRSEANSKSKIIILVPNGTQLEALETKDDWYKITYMGKTGWVSKQYVTLTAPAEDPTKAWKTYQNNAQNYALRYPTDWVAQDYGANPATNSSSYIAFGPQLPATMDPSNPPPVIVRIVPGGADAAAATYKASAGSVATPATIAGLAGTSYTYTASSGVQMTAYVVAKGAQTFIIEETGGYADQLQKIVTSLSLG
jgi:hypothetical protein